MSQIKALYYQKLLCWKLIKNVTVYKVHFPLNKINHVWKQLKWKCNATYNKLTRLLKLDVLWKMFSFVRLYKILHLRFSPFSNDVFYLHCQKIKQEFPLLLNNIKIYFFVILLKRKKNFKIFCCVIQENMWEIEPQNFKAFMFCAIFLDVNQKHVWQTYIVVCAFTNDFIIEMMTKKIK